MTSAARSTASPTTAAAKTSETVWAISPAGVHTVLHAFTGGSDGAYPGGLINVNGVLYGFTFGGGTANAGTAFSVTTSGVETVLYSFGATSTDGANPSGVPAYVNGLLYGATYHGGTAGCSQGGCGTIFSMSLTGAETVLYSFPASYSSNNNPSSLIESGGLLYGTGQFGPKGCGVIFSLSLQGQFTDAYDFNKSQNDGCGPSGPLLDVNGVLYGTTAIGGEYAWGTLYAFTP